MRAAPEQGLMQASSLPLLCKPEPSPNLQEWHEPCSSDT